MLDKILGYIDKCPADMGAYTDALAWIKTYGTADDADGLKERIRLATEKYKDDVQTIDRLYEVNRKVLCFCAPERLDDFILYMEIDRPYERKFYLPRRKQLKPVVDQLERLERRDIDLLCISLPPGVGKTTLAEFFLTWTAGRHPEMPNLTGSHSASFLRGMYGEFLRLLDPDGEYRWSDVFRGLKVVNTNAQDLMIDIADDPRKSKRFMTIEMTSIGAGNAGKVRAGNLLYCDDLVDGLETAMSKERLDKLYQTYATDFRQRKIGKCAELHIATRWSVHDVIGRLEQARGEDPKAKFIALPALDEHDQSNFDYPIEAGFTTEFYHEQREAMDDVSWRCLYMNEPIEREGQLYQEDELRRFFDLPGAVYENGELVSFDTPDAILAVCDTKDRGEDYCFCPIDYQYGDDHYIIAVVCNDGTPGVVEEELIDKHLRYNVQMSQFESNAAGRRVAEHVQEEIKARGGRTKVVTRYTTQNKETKIIVNSQWVKDHCLFLAKPKDKAYRRAMSFLTGYTMKGKNKHDDVPDGMAQLAQFAQSFENSKVTVMRSPFRL